MKTNILPILLLGAFLMLSCNDQNKSDETAIIEQKIDSLIQLMTLEEKINMIHATSAFTSGGVKRLGIPELVMSDGPHGIRHEHGRDWEPDENADDSVSYLPTGIALGSTWNRELGYRYGAVLGSEANARGKDVLLGPGINIIRTPLNGRNFEYISEDPYLTAQMAIGYIEGVQDQDVAACPKHYVANNQETWRKDVDVRMSEQALREIYMPAFKASVEEAGALTIMGAYNQFRGQHCSHHEYLVNDVLKGEYDFKGALISDWSAVTNTEEALLYGTDIEMGTDLTMLPNPDYSQFYLADSALAMINRGEVDEAYVDDKVRRILRVMHGIHIFGDRKQGEVNTSEHQQLALQVAEESMVLLKNNDMLPLQSGEIQTLAVIGHNSTQKHAEEGGSSQVRTLYEVTPLEGIRNLVGDKVEILHTKGYEPNLENAYNKALADEAVAVARNADAVVFVGGWAHNISGDNWGDDGIDSEGADKENLKLMFGQEKLINRIAEVNPKLAVVIMGGSNVEMKGWMDQAPAIVQAWYAGMEGGNALANILFGKVNPSGKLPMTFANAHTDYPAHAIGEFPGDSINKVVHYKEEYLVGYRYFDTKNLEPLFPFGHGLSYTTFAFDRIKVNQSGDHIMVTCSVENTGDREGAEVVQVYVHAKDQKGKRPLKALKGFEKVYLQPGESQNVKIKLSQKDFQYYDEEKGDWHLAPGVYEIQVGSSSRDIRLKKEIDL